MRKRKLLTLILSVAMIFTMIPMGMAVNAAQTDSSSESALPFKDVDPGSWYYDSVEYAYYHNLMNGTGEDKFTPNGTLTRAMFVTILGRMANVDQSQYPGSSFSDVPAGEWYSAYIEWAVKNNITTGIGDGKFGTNNNILREQMATLIARYVDAAGIDLPDDPDPVKSFKDIDKVDSWALEGLELMRKSGLIKGDDNGYFNPLDSATRAQAATIFQRLQKAVRPDVSVGDIITFGRYQQKRKLGDADPIDWIVLKKENGKALIVSRYAIHGQQYDEDNGAVTWADCSLRKWLNETFINDAFSQAEQKQICQTDISNPDSYWGYDADNERTANNTGEGLSGMITKVSGGADTSDKVFLLSIDEARELFGFEKQTLEYTDGGTYTGHPDLQASCTDWANAFSTFRSENMITPEGDACCNWWLRSSGSEDSSAACVGFNGGLFSEGNSFSTIGVRPALWIDLDSADYGTPLYTVSFETFDGSAVSAQKVELRDTAVKPADPTKNGFKFEGWYSDEELTKAFDFKTPVIKNMTLYAKWSGKCNVTFDSNGGSEVKAQAVDWNDKVSKPAAPEKEGCSFVGWYTDKALTKLYDFNSKVISDLTLYAKWEEIIYFGSYEQDNDTSNGKEPIEWIKLKEENGSIMLISRYALDCKQYNNTEGDVTWESCSLRKWLNTEFMNAAFNRTDQDRLLEMTISNPDTYNGTDKDGTWTINNTGTGIVDIWTQINGGNDTKDKVFLLSIDEAVSLMGYELQILTDKDGEQYEGNPNLQVNFTAYAEAQGVYPDSSCVSHDGRPCCSWWLRSSGDYADDAAVVSDGGRFYCGYDLNDSTAVRPVIWIKTR